MTIENKPAIWLTSLRNYNEGAYTGNWLELPVAPEDLKKYMNENVGDPNINEHIILDYENFPWRIDEYDDPTLLNQFVADQEDLFKAWSTYLDKDEYDVDAKARLLMAILNDVFDNDEISNAYFDYGDMVDLGLGLEKLTAEFVQLGENQDIYSTLGDFYGNWNAEEFHQAVGFYVDGLGKVAMLTKQELEEQKQADSDFAWYDKEELDDYAFNQLQEQNLIVFDSSANAAYRSNYRQNIDFENTYDSLEGIFGDVNDANIYHENGIGRFEPVQFPSDLQELEEAVSNESLAVYETFTTDYYNDLVQEHGTELNQ